MTKLSDPQLLGSGSLSLSYLQVSMVAGISVHEFAMVDGPEVAACS
jgi:hypothetical protein